VVKVTIEKGIDMIDNLCKKCFSTSSPWPKVQCYNYPMFGYGTNKVICSSYMTAKDKATLIICANLVQEFFEQRRTS